MIYGVIENSKKELSNEMIKSDFQNQYRSSTNYHVLLLITDGVISDLHRDKKWGHNKIFEANQVGRIRYHQLKGGPKSYFKICYFTDF